LLQVVAVQATQVQAVAVLVATELHQVLLSQQVLQLL
jgi:hypothetical protein